ncbi:MAG: M24 family metallopeptidase [Steroidobacteraceae bacterium]
MYFPREEYEARWKRVRATMRARGHETLVIWQRSAGGFDRAGDVYWLTNYASSASGQEPSREGLSIGRGFAAVLFHRGRDPELHIAEAVRDIDVSELACGEIVTHAIDLPTGLAERLRVLGIEGPVSYVGDDFLPALFDRRLRRAAPAVEWIPDDWLLTDAQNIKSARELEAYRTAGDIATRSLNAIMVALIEGEPESEAAARGGAVVLRAGGGFQRVSIHHGAPSEVAMWSNPMYGFSTTAPRPGDMVRGWIYGPLFQGYWLDPGRSAVCGNKPTMPQREVIEGVNSIVTTIMAAIRPGVTPRQASIVGEAAARRVGYFDHPQAASIWGIFGHGLGSYFKPPLLPSTDPAHCADPKGYFHLDEPFRPGMVATVEAFLTHTGVGTGTCEQCFIVTEEGIELLTHTPLIFW